MARIKCKNCGKAYRYETEGCCPECGAYNRPPRHEKVNADGTIYHMKDADYLEKRHAKPHGSKVCFEEKECYEEKACYEEQGYYEEENPTTGEAAFTAPTLNRIRQQRKPAKVLIPVIIVSIVILVMSLANVLQSCSYEVSYVDENIDPTLVQYTVLDGTATAYMQNAYNVEYSTLWYVDTEGYLSSADSENIVCKDGLCTVEFSVGEDYQTADSIEIYCNGDWVNMMVDPTATVVKE